MKGSGYRRYGGLSITGVAMALVATFSPSIAQDRGTCVTADVPEAYVLPDGSTHAAGRLTLCVIEAFTPVVGLHRIDAGVDGPRMAMSRRDTAGEYVGDEAQVVFRRSPDGGLRLAGYVLPNGGHPLRYAFQAAASWPRVGADTSVAWAPKGSSEVLWLDAVVR